MSQKYNKAIKLNRQQTALLKFFIENRNTLLTNEMIELKIWSNKIVKDTTRISLISKLRSKCNHRFITTFYGLGYVFKI